MLFYNPLGAGEAFFQLAYALGLDFADDGRAAAPVDIDGDGDLDLVMTSLQTIRLLENRIDAAGHFARLRLIGKTRHALGARVWLKAGKTLQQEWVRVVEGFQTQVAPELHFGLAAAEKIDELLIRWPSGLEQVFTDLPVDRLLVVVEGQDPSVRELPRWPARSRRATRPSLEAPAKTLDGEPKPLGARGRPTLVNFWAPWCAPCNTELPELAALAKARPEVDFVGVSVERKDLTAVRAALARHRIEYGQRVSDDALMEAFFGADGEAPLPSTFLFGADGALVRAFRRSVGGAELAAALTALELPPINTEFFLPLSESAIEQGDLATAERAARQGIALEPDDVDLRLQLANLLVMQKAYAEAEGHLRHAVKVDPSVAYAHYLLGAVLDESGRAELARPSLARALELAPERLTWAISYGALLERLGEGEPALEVFERVVARDEQQGEVWAAIAALRQRLGRPGVEQAVQRARALGVAAEGRLADSPR